MMPTEIYDNLSLTDRAMKRLLSFPFFRAVDENSGEEAALLTWSLLSRKPNHEGVWECEKGPGFDLSTIALKDVPSHPRTYAFRIDGRILCVQFSKDRDFDPATRFRLDFNREFILYLAAMDEGEFARVPPDLKR